MLTSSDGTLAAVAAADLTAHADRPAYVLTGVTGAGNQLHPFEDVARSAHQIHGDRFAAFREYLDWEIGLVAQLERDKTANFRVFPASA